MSRDSETRRGKSCFLATLRNPPAVPSFTEAWDLHLPDLLLLLAC